MHNMYIEMEKKKMQRAIDRLQLMHAVWHTFQT